MNRRCTGDSCLAEAGGTVSLPGYARCYCPVESTAGVESFGYR